MINIYLYKTELLLCDNNFCKIVDNIVDSNYIFLSYKIYSKRTGIKFVDEDTIPLINEALELSKKYKKKIIYLCGGDRPPVILPNHDNIIVLNTSVDLSKMPKNEMVIGVNLEDKFMHYIEKPTLSIGFCGNKNGGREYWLNFLNNNQEIKTDFIIRENYIHRLKSSQINDFERNMNNNLFIFCYRGAGNFSVRFYETLMRGRIPIVIKTDNIFPFENIIDYNKIGIFIEEKEIKNNDVLKNIILNYYNSKSSQELINIQKYNRSIYLKYFHKNVFIQEIFKYIHKYYK